MARHENEKVHYVAVFIGVMILLIHLYYFAYPLWEGLGFTHPSVVRLFLRLRNGGFFDNPYYTKGYALMLSVVTTFIRRGKTIHTEWWKICTTLGVALVLYFIPFRNPAAYTLFSLAGYGVIVYTISMAVQKLTGFIKKTNDNKETFEQCEEKIDTKYSINLPTRYQYKHKVRNGWINIVNPFRGTLVLGTPGSGKSYSVYTPFMEQMIKKGYTMFVYDFKYPALTDDVFNIFMQNLDAYGKQGIRKPTFCVVNFDDPRYSLRCNPLNPAYIDSLTDCKEIAEVIMKNLAETDKKDFFTQSAQLYTDCCISFLWVYDNGRYCSFPHLVELMCRPAEHVIELISKYPEIKTKVASFKEALQKKANEQLAGQTNSATVPLAGMSTPSLYWVLSGDDFKLDINNPDEPKIVCVGNDPNNQNTYGAALALFFSRLFKLINHPGKLKSAILLDEAPTVIIKGLDHLLATSRSNLVATVLGGQDKSQFVRDYGEKYANVIFNNVGNIISGQVNGKTAEELSRSFGKEFRERQSQTVGDDSESIQVSFSQEDIMPASKIETLSQGTFFGKVADDFDCKIEKKFFCGEIIIDNEAVKARKANRKGLPKMTDFGERKIRERILNGDMKDAALRNYAVRQMHRKGIMDSITESDIQKIISKMTEDDIENYLSTYAEKYTEEHIHNIVLENYHRIQQDIQNIMDAHGIPGQPESDNNTSAPSEEDVDDIDDGIRESEVPDDMDYSSEGYVE